MLLNNVILLGTICSFLVDQTSITKTLREEYGVNHEWQCLAAITSH
jgi:hypothetical protein